MLKTIIGWIKKKRIAVIAGSTALVLAVIVALIVVNTGNGQNTSADDDAYPDYQLSEEIEAALLQLKNDPQKARLIKQAAVQDQKIALVFEGLPSHGMTLKLLELLEKYDTKATFFVTGIQAAQYPEALPQILSYGHELGNYTLKAEKRLETFTSEELISDFIRASQLIENAAQMRPTSIKCNVTQYTQEVLQAAYVCGFTEAVSSTAYLNYQSFKNSEEVQGYVDRLPYGSILSVKTTEELDPSEYQPKETAAQPEGPEPIESQQPSPTLLPSSKDDQLLTTVEWLLAAINNTNFDPQSIPARIENDGKLATPVKQIKTIERAVAYTFYQLGNQEELGGILNSLEQLNATATFFVSAQETQDYPDEISRIMQQGHSIGIALLPTHVTDYYSAYYEIAKTQNQLEERYGYVARAVMQPWGEMQEEALEAVSALGMSLISYDSTVAREDTKEDTSAEAIIEKIFGQRQYALHRGQILYCRMDYFEKGDHILGSLLLELEKERNIYPIVDVLSILENEEYLYQYPLPEEDILKGVKDRIHSGQLDGDLMEYVEKYYIGNVNINYSEKLPGFSAQELARIDMKGNIHNEERAVFLTFDDWGTDAAIEKLLSVLEKHDVKATFYVRTNYVAGNTNLLRAIAMEGHEIASHTHEHIPISIQTDQEKDVYRDLTDEEAQVLQKDLIQSYNVLQSIVGDVLLEDGRPALSTTFRPPTLAVGRKGMEVVFDSGFTYIVNGDYTTKDYLADDAQTLYRQLKSSIRNGSVVIMHMSDNSVYTAEALDLFLTENAQKAPHEQFVFRRVCDYLDGTYENE